MIFLNSDIQRHIGSFLDPKTIVAVAIADTTAEKTHYNNLQNQYKVHFGSLTSDTLNPSGSTLRSLLSSVEKQPDAAIDHNIYQVPTNCLERWKWLVGVENSLDKKVQESYENRIRLLEASQATSIIQLKNQLIAFWHSNQQIRDYEKFKSRATSEATKGKINAIFLKCVGFFLKLYSNSSRSLLDLVKPLKSRYETTFAKIGAVESNKKSYDVVAFRQLSPSLREYTYIGIVEQGLPYKLSLDIVRRNSPHFSILMKPKDENTDSYQIPSEGNGDHGTPAFQNHQRRLLIDTLNYKGSTEDPRGSDRLLDQKLTQIMVEMTKQNKDIISLSVRSSNDELIVLSAGGFTSTKYTNLMQELGSFRKDEENKLFPPYSNYGGIPATFLSEWFEHKSVYLSQKKPESWAEIIDRSTILNPDAAVLPEDSE